MLENDPAAPDVQTTPTGPEAAFKELRRSGFRMKKPSVLGKDSRAREHAVKN
jgi:hypothetical protein